MIVSSKETVDLFLNVQFLLQLSQMSESSNKHHPFYFIFLLILAGEAVFILPFVLARIFRPTFLDLFQVTNLELGLCFSVYGIVAVVAYFFGGLIADRFSPGKIMGMALVATALGGVYLAQYPSIFQLKLLYGYWGLTTILIFWAAMIKATRIWGGKDRQGKAFGFLDGGRGLVAAGFGSLGLYVLSLFVVGDLESLSFPERQNAFKYLILTFSAVVALVGIVVYFLFAVDNPPSEDLHDSKNKEIFSSKSIKAVLQYKSIWLIMIIILTGYCGYKVTDIFSLYARDVMLFDEIKAAKIGTLLLYIRPILGIVVGVLADRTRASLWLFTGFLVMLIGFAVLASGIIGPNVTALFGISLVCTALGVYAIRSLYFSIMEEGNIPVVLTGTAVGLVSLVGYTPDIFMGPLIGVLLDNNPGELGHQYVFGILSVLSLLGLVATALFRKWNRGAANAKNF